MKKNVDEKPDNQRSIIPGVHYLQYQTDEKTTEITFKTSALPPSFVDIHVYATCCIVNGVLFGLIEIHIQCRYLIWCIKGYAFLFTCIQFRFIGQLKY